jgi:hypothetical protein
MNYSINIVYTGNQRKAGKLTLTDTDNNEVLLNKVPVAIPTQLMDQNTNSVAVSLELKNTSKKSEYAADAEYSRVADKFRLLELNSVVATNASLNFIANIPLGNNRDSLNATDDSFVLHKDDYEKIKSVANGKSFNFTGQNNQFQLNTEKVMFLWFPEKVNIDKNETNITKAVKELVTKEDAANSKLHEEFSSRDTQKTTKTDTVKVGKPVNTEKSAVKTTKTVLLTEKEKSDQDARRLKDQERINRENTLAEQREYERREYQRHEQERRDYDNRNSGNLDALDIVLMYNNPELAPIFKPNSMLA